MKKINFLLILLIIAISSCHRDDSISSSSVLSAQDQENLEKIQSASYYTFDSKTDLLTDSVVLDSTLDVETMYDVSEMLEAAIGDSTLTDVYFNIVDQYSDILEEVEDSDYTVIVKSDILEKRINSNGVVAVGDSVYVFDNEKTYKYLYTSDGISLIETFDVNITILKDIVVSLTNYSRPYTVSDDADADTEEISLNHNFVKNNRKAAIHGYVVKVADLTYTLGATITWYKKNVWSWKKYNCSCLFSITYDLSTSDGTSETNTVWCPNQTTSAHQHSISQNIADSEGGLTFDMLLIDFEDSGKHVEANWHIVI